MKTDFIRPLARRGAASLIIAVAMAALLPTAAVAMSQETTTALFRVSNASIESAHQLVLGVCSNAGNGCTDVRFLQSESMVAVAAEPAVHERIRALLAELDKPFATRTFQVIVLAADGSGERSADVPANVDDALADISDFLPYSGFRMLGSGLLRAAARGETTLPGPMDLRAELRFRPTTDPTASLLVEHFSVTHSQPVERVEDGVVTMGIRRDQIVEATFTIDPGQTVVVGVSKLNGDDSAVVVLLTAVQD